MLPNSSSFPPLQQGCKILHEVYHTLKNKLKDEKVKLNLLNSLLPVIL